MNKGTMFLHNHPKMEEKLGLDSDHVIVDRDAWEEARKQCNIADVMQWVAVEDCLPEKEGRYICRRKYKGIISIEKYYPKHPENWVKFTGVTHWMPIVEPPCA